MSSPTSATDDESEISESSSASSAHRRPNKWNGPPSTWRYFTEDETALATSLVRLRDQDLSVHLYNAHAMKRRLYDPKVYSSLESWAPKDTWGESFGKHNNDESSLFVPPKSWTAWPLVSQVVPRSREHVGPKDGEEDYTLRSEEIQYPSFELEVVLAGITLRVAKDRFLERQWDDAVEDVDITGDKSPEVEVDMDYSTTSDREDESKTSGNTSMSKGTRASRDKLSDVNMDSRPTSEPAGGSLVSGGKGISKSTRISEGNDQPRLFSSAIGEPTSIVKSEVEVEVKEPSEEPPGFLDPVLQPIVSADDERSFEILRPTIRQTLSKLDQLLMALHHARETCLNYKSDTSDTQCEFSDESDPESKNNIGKGKSPQVEASEKRPVGRPRKIIDASSVSSEKEDQEDDGLSEKKTKRGRKRHIHVPREGESHQEMLFRIARLQKKPLPFTSSSRSRSKSEGRSTSRHRQSSIDSQTRRKRRLGTRDWSEVLGTAALVGFSPEVIYRAAQRCATLFGEGMTMRVLTETAPGMGKDDIVKFFPELIPEFEESESDWVVQPRDTKQEKLYGRRRPNARKKKIDLDIVSEVDEKFTSESAPHFSFWCPFPDCVRHKEGFKQKAHLKSHLKRAHKLSDDKVEQALMGGTEEMEGAVHNDGFLKPLSVVGRGMDQATRTRTMGKDRKKSLGKEMSVSDMKENSDSSDELKVKSDSGT